MSEPNHLGSMGKAMQVHQLALKLLRCRMQDVNADTGLYRAIVSGVMVTGSASVVNVYLDQETQEVGIYKWSYQLGVVSLAYNPKLLDTAIDRLQRALVLDELADV